MVRVYGLVCVQHGHVVNGVRVPCERTDKWKYENEITS